MSKNVPMNSRKPQNSLAVALTVGVTLGLGSPAPAAAAPTDGEASSPSLSGRLFTNFYLPGIGNSDSALLQQNNEAWLSVSHRASETVNAKLTFMLRSLDRPKDEIQTTETEIREAYVRYFQNGVDLQTGRQLLPWGKADAINPTDYFSAKDLRLFNPDEEVRRRGPTALLLGFTPEQGSSPLSFTTVIAPIFSQTRLLIPPRLISTGVTLNDPEEPRVKLRDLEVALKVSYTGSGWDFSTSAFHGWNHLPNLSSPVLNASAGIPTISISQTFNRISALGADFSASLGSYVFRAEGAARFTENRDGRNAAISPAQQEIVAGFERPLGDRLRAQLQGTYRHISNYSQWTQAVAALAPVEQAVAQANSALQGYQFEHSPGATVRLSYLSSEEDWRSELFILSTFSTSGAFGAQTGSTAQYLIRPKITHEWTSGFETTLGLDHFLGSAGTLLGASQDYRNVFFEALYAF